MMYINSKMVSFVDRRCCSTRYAHLMDESLCSTWYLKKTICCSMQDVVRACRICHTEVGEILSFLTQEMIIQEVIDKKKPRAEEEQGKYK